MLSQHILLGSGQWLGSKVSAVIVFFAHSEVLQNYDGLSYLF